MIPYLLAATLALTTGADHHFHRPKAVVAKPKPPPPPPPPEDDDADAPLDLPDEPDTTVSDDTADAHLGASGADDGKRTSVNGVFPDGTPDWDSKEAQTGLGAVGCGCCCFFFVIALILYFIFRKKKPAPPVTQPFAAPPPPAPAFHLSVLALGLRAQARQVVAQNLILAGVNADPATAPERAQLVREAAKALRTLEPEWSQFGYGERLDLGTEAAAQQSYQLAVDDFARRSADGSFSGEAGYEVVTLVLCTRRQLRGVSALDDRAQIRSLLDDRSALTELDLMGAYLVWTPPLGASEVLSRFPEMHAVK